MAKHGRTARACERLLAWLVTGRPWSPAVAADWDRVYDCDWNALSEIERLMAIQDGWVGTWGL